MPEQSSAAVAAGATTEQRYYDALKRIASYTPPEKLHSTSRKEYGLPPSEAIEYAYENVIEEADAFADQPFLKTGESGVVLAPVGYVPTYTNSPSTSFSPCSMRCSWSP